MRHGLLVYAVPVFGDFALRLFERQASGTNLGVQIILDLILAVRAAVGDGGLKRLGPEIARIGGIAAELQGNEMILLVIPDTRIGVSVFANLLDFQTVRVAGFRANQPGAPARIADRVADIRLRDVRVHGAGSSRGIGIDIRRTNARY